MKRYETTPVQQITRETLFRARNHAARQFPHLASHIARYAIPVTTLKDTMLTQDLLILQLSFCEEYCGEGETILNVARTHSPSACSEIERTMPKGNHATIVVHNGYQGVRDHTGAGLIHIGEQRMEALRQFYRQGGEHDDAMVQRFFEDAVVHVAGTATLELPSDYDPTRYAILLAPVARANNKQFAGVIVDISGEKYRVVTTLFQESPKQLRGDLRNMLKRLKEKSLFTASN